MNHQLTNEEQFLEIKEFFANTWKTIFAVIIIGLFAIWGWRYWQTYKNEKAMEASDQYEQLIAELDNSASPSAEKLIAFSKSNDTIYSVFASLRVAKFYVETSKDYTAAELLLIEALKKANEDELQSIINIQIARLQYQLAHYQDSLATLNKVTGDNWAAIVNQIKGDIFIKLERYDNAVSAYNIALISSPTPELEKNIKMKLNKAEYLKIQQTSIPKSE